MAIGTTTLEGVLTRGGSVIAEGIQSVSEEEMQSARETGLALLDGALRDLIGQLGCRRGDRTIVIGYPNAGSVIHRVGASGDAVLAQSNELAAVHACTGHEASELVTQSWNWKTKSLNEEREIVLSGAVPDSVLTDIAEWVNRSGMAFDGFIPIQMWETALALQDAERCALDTVCCRIGPESTVLVIRTPDQDFIVRAIEFGAQVLANVYTRAAANRGSSCRHDEAWSLISQHGVRWDSRSSMGDIARDAMPMISPVLQRFNIELKQTLRYSVETEAKSRRIRCSGIGQQVPGLCSAISEHLELDLENPIECGDPIDGSPSQIRELGIERVREIQARQLFRPRIQSRQRKLRRTASVAVQSGVIAAAMVFGEYQILTVKAKNMTDRIAVLEKQISVYDESVLQGNMLVQDKQETLDQLMAMGEIYGRAPHWPGMIRELIEQSDIEIQSIRVTAGEKSANAVLTGWLPLSMGESVLREQLDKWRSRGGIKGVEPSSLVRTTEKGQDLLRFTLEFDLERFPVWFHHPELASLIEMGGIDGHP